MISDDAMKQFKRKQRSGLVGEGGGGVIMLQATKPNMVLKLVLVSEA